MAKRHLVATLVGEGVAEFEMAVACEIFGYDRSALAGGRPWYRHVLAAAGPDVRTMHGMRVDAEPGLAALRKADTIVVTPWKDSRVAVPEEVLEALRAAHRRGARLLSLCSGAFVLGATGLLDGRRATTHWAYVDEFARRFPEVKLDPGVLYVDEGDILTAAGSAAAIDLCLHIVRMDYGAETANNVARRLVVPPHRDGGQAQYINQPMATSCSDEAFGLVLDWALEHLDETLTVDDLARRAAMSPRTFAAPVWAGHGDDAAPVAVASARAGRPADARNRGRWCRGGGPQLWLRHGIGAAGPLPESRRHVAAGLPPYLSGAGRLNAPSRRRTARVGLLLRA